MGILRRSIVCVLCLAACKPDLGDRASLVSTTRVLAVRGNPAEAKPGAVVTYDLLVAGPDGTVVAPSVAWAFCATPAGPAENGAVSPACTADGVRPIGVTSGAVTTAIPGDACTLFGPDPPPGDFRPPDPDTTGGYYLPVRAQTSGAAAAFGLERVTCNLADAPFDAAAELARRYVANENPKLSPMPAIDGVATGGRVALVVTWGALDAEAYVAFDPQSQSVVARREAMRVSWFATAGSFDADHTGRGEADAVTTSENGWTAPHTPGVVHFWVVLRDSRGGADFASFDVTVR